MQEYNPRKWPNSLVLSLSRKEELPPVKVRTTNLMYTKKQMAKELPENVLSLCYFFIVNIFVSTLVYNDFIINICEILS